MASLYGEQVGLPIDAKEFVLSARQWLTQLRTRQIDRFQRTMLFGL
jgi:hypothetical protein